MASLKRDSEKKAERTQVEQQDSRSDKMKLYLVPSCRICMHGRVTVTVAHLFISEIPSSPHPIPATLSNKNRNWLCPQVHPLACLKLTN